MSEVRSDSTPSSSTDEHAGTALARWGSYVAHNPRKVLWLSIAVVVVFVALTPIFTSRLLGIGYDTPGSESAKSAEIVEDNLGSQESILLVVSSDSKTADDPGFARLLDEAIRIVSEDDGVASVLPASQGGGVSEDRSVVFRTVLLEGDVGERQDTSKSLKDDVEDMGEDGVEVGLSGESPFFVDLLHAEEEGLVLAEAVGLPLALIVLFVTLGSVIAAGLPILVGLGGTIGALGILGFLSLFTDFDVFAENGVVMIGLACGIDYALLIVRRFREESTRVDVVVATSRTMATAGRTVLFSGATVMVALLPLVLIDIPSLSKFAFAALLGVAASVASALVLLPAILVRLGDRVHKVRLKSLRERGFDDGGGSVRWAQLARSVMRRPWLVLVPFVGLLLLAASPLLDAKQGIDLNVRAYEDEPSVETLSTLEEAFPAITLGRVEVAVEGGGAAARAAAEGVLAADDRLQGIESFELNGDSYLVTANLTLPDDSKEAEDAVKDARRNLDPALPAGAEAYVGGTTARSIDYADEVLDKTAVVIVLTMALCFLLLLMVFRSPVLAAKAVIANLLSIGASMGLVVLVFQDGHFENLLDFTSPGYIQAWMPLILFAVLFGLSMDYEVFLVTRIREEFQRTGNNDEAVAIGLAKTGGVITSAALIMIFIFGAFMLCPAPEIKQLGFGLAAAVLIDATIIRALLVPAFMKIVGPWNWWCPAWLDRILPKISH